MKLRFLTVFLFGVLAFLGLAGTALSQAPDTRIQHLYEEAQSEEKAGRLDRAVEKYEAITQLDPKLATAYHNLGRLYFAQNRMDEAIKALRHALELDPKLGPTHSLLGISYFQIGDYKKARQELQTALSLTPGDQNARLYLARSLYHLDDYEEAFPILEKLRKKDPKNPDVLYYLGLAYTKRAEATFQDLQNAAPDSYFLEVVLGQFAEMKRVYPEAVDHYQKALAKNPEASGLHYMLAHALWASGRFQEAVPEYRRSLELDPYDSNSHWEMARIILPENPEEAYRQVNEALQLNADIPEAFSIRGRALLALNRPREAIADLKKAGVLDPEDATIHLQLARAYRQLGEAQEAQSETAIYERLEKESHSPSGDQKVAPQ